MLQKQTDRWSTYNAGSKKHTFQNILHLQKSATAITRTFRLIPGHSFPQKAFVQHHRVVVYLQLVSFFLLHRDAPWIHLSLLWLQPVIT